MTDTLFKKMGGLFLCGLTLLAFACSTGARADPFPSRPITLIVPFSAGGSTDIQARALAAAASRELGQPIVVVNRPGVAGTLGPGAMARSAPGDGYTLSIIAGSFFRIPYLQPVKYDPLKDFTYIIGVTGFTVGITVARDAPWKDLPELIAYAKANPGKVSFGTAGVGSTGHMMMAQFAESAGVQLTFVPFKGASEIFPALLGGHIDIAGEAGFGATVDGEKGRLLATFSESRLKRRATVPTLKELGYDVTSKAMWGIAGPRGMEPKTVHALHDAFRRAMSDPGFIQAVDQQDQPLIYLSSEDYTKYAMEESRNEKKLVARFGLKLN